MSMTAGPHLPKDGWMVRWLKQAAQLILRCPEAVVMSGIFALITSIVFLTAGSLLVMSGLSSDTAVLLISVAMTPAAVVMTALIMNRIMIADLGTGLTWAEVYACTKKIMPLALMYAAGLGIFSMALDFVLPSPDLAGTGSTADSSGSSTSPEPNLFTMFAVMIQLGGAEMTGIFLPLALLHPFAIAAVLGNNFSETELRHNDNMLKVKSFRVHTQLFFTVVFLPLAGILFPGVLNMFFVPILIAWNYVGGREVVGGIDKNGKGQEQTELGAASAGAF